MALKLKEVEWANQLLKWVHKCRDKRRLALLTATPDPAFMPHKTEDDWADFIRKLHWTPNNNISGWFETLERANVIVHAIRLVYQRFFTPKK